MKKPRSNSQGLGGAVARLVSSTSAASVALLGCVGLAGWSFHIPLFCTVLPGLPSMKANTALSLLLTGLSILLLRQEPVSRRRRYLARAAASVVVSIAGMTLLEYALKYDLGIDQLVFIDRFLPASASPGRMAPLTATSFGLLGAALLFEDNARARLRQIGHASALLSVSLGLVGLIGYGYSAVSYSRLVSFTSMALHTAFAIALAGLGLLCSRQREGVMAVVLSRGPGGAIARHLLPVGVVAPVLLGWLTLSGEWAGYYGADVGVAVLVMILLAILMVAVLLTARAIDNSDRARRAAEEQARDLAEQRRVEGALFLEKERAHVTLVSIGDAVVSTDSFGNITYLNPVAEQMTGWSLPEVAGLPMAKAVQILDAADWVSDEGAMEEARENSRGMNPLLHRILIRRDGSSVPIEDSNSAIHDCDGKTSGAVIVFRDVSVRLEMMLKLAHFAKHDFLTDLPNRMLLNDRITQAIALASRQSKHVALLFLDLDNFKHINDSLGHSIGDRLLQAVSKRLVDCVRSMDTVSRQGGDEFIVLLPAMEHPHDTSVAAKRLLQVITAPYSIDKHELHITTSIGVSVYPEDGWDAETLIKNADTAMYQAKENGRQSYKFFNQSMNLRVVERQFIEESLRRALQREEFVLHYQPKVDLATGKITGAEALIRWTHPTRGPIPPVQFIPVAEECGLIHPISKWALREACRQTRVWLDAGLSCASMAVNVCASEFRNEHFLRDVFDILEETDMDPMRLELEITEGVLMKHAESAQVILTALRAKGIQIAVDDFGTGYSSLSYLRRFSIDALKIDQSFVRQITTSPDENAIVIAVISMARSLRLRVVAEGVETPEELAFLQAHRCELGQGYFFSRPVPPDQFAYLLENGVPYVPFELSSLEILT